MIVREKYTIVFKKYFIITTNEENICPDCGSILKIRDSKKRTVKNENGEVYTFSLRRLYCNGCRKLHIEVPDFIDKNKQYSKNVIENVTSGKCDYCVADNSTIYRWKIHKHTYFAFLARSKNDKVSFWRC